MKPTFKHGRIRRAAKKGRGRRRGVGRREPGKKAFSNLPESGGGWAAAQWWVWWSWSGVVQLLAPCSSSRAAVGVGVGEGMCGHLGRGTEQALMVRFKSRTDRQSLGGRVGRGCRGHGAGGAQSRPSALGKRGPSCPPDAMEGSVWVCSPEPFPLLSDGISLITCFFLSRFAPGTAL